MLKDASGNIGMLLLKLGQREYMEQFRKGLLYMNTLKYFRDLESDPARADRYEGVTQMFQPKDSIITFSAPGFEKIVLNPESLTAATTISMDSELRCKVFCLYAITAPVNGTLFPPEHEWFGDSVVLVRNTWEFFRRVSTAVKARELGFRSRLVKYFDDETYTGSLGKFCKSNRFSYQREFRIAIDSPGNDPLSLDIGNIADITSEVLPFCSADDILKFSEDDARAAGLH